MGELTHFNEQGRARMVDVTEKAVTHRRAVAAGRSAYHRKLWSISKTVP